MHVKKSSNAALADVSLNSFALARVISEVRSEKPLQTAGAYNRTYNRHNR